MVFAVNIWVFRAFVVALILQKRAKEGAENYGYIKHLEYISLLESINANLLWLLFRAKKNCILAGLILLLDARCCCSAGKCLSLKVISVPHQRVWRSQG